MKPADLVVAGLVALFLAVRWRRLSTELRVLLVLVVGGVAAYGSGAFQLPNVEKGIVKVGESLGAWTYLLVGVMAFAETGAFLGFVAPGEFTVILGGVIAGQGKIELIPLIGIVWVAAVTGDVTSYALGRRLGRGFLERHGPRVKITEQRLAQVERFFERRGGMTILVGRFLGLVRPIAPFLAGSSRMPFRRFIPYDLVAAGVWGTTFVVVGYVFWQSFDQVVAVAKRGALALGVVIVVVAALVVAVRRLRDPDERARLAAWASVQARRPALRPLVRVGTPVWQRLVVPVGRALSGPAGFARNRLTPGDLGLEVTTLLAAGGVGAFAFVGYLVTLQGVALTPGDRRAFDLAGHLHTSAGIDVARALTWLGAAPVTWTVVFGAAAWLASRRRTLEAATLACGMGLTILLVHVVKSAQARPRPLHPYVSADGLSFPSGHAAYATALVAVAVALARWAPGLARLGLVGASVIVAVVVGLTRIYLRAHYLSDVLAGAGLSAALFSICGIVALIVDFVRHNAGRAP